MPDTIGVIHFTTVVTNIRVGLDYFGPKDTWKRAKYKGEVSKQLEM